MFLLHLAAGQHNGASGVAFLRLGFMGTYPGGYPSHPAGPWDQHPAPADSWGGQRYCGRAVSPERHVQHDIWYQPGECVRLCLCLCLSTCKRAGISTRTNRCHYRAQDFVVILLTHVHPVP